ncbi:hypothetical protein ACFX1Z_002559 [Malus domestica]
MGKHYHSSNKGKLEHGGPNDVLNKSAETSYLNKVSMVEAKTSDKNPPSRISPTQKTTSIYKGSTGSDVSDESNSSSLSSAIYKPHKANDVRWEAVQAA